MKRSKIAKELESGLRPDTDMEDLLSGLLRDADGSVSREEIEVDPGLEAWIPAYYDSSQACSVRMVKDPTGAGNTFLGGLGISLARGKSIEEAALCGTVSASFALEQVGVPTLGRDDSGRETWNDDDVQRRLHILRHRPREKRPFMSLRH